MFNPNLIPNSPPRAEDPRVNKQAERLARAQFEDFLDSMMETLIEREEDEDRKNGSKVVLYGKRVKDAITKIQKFADFTACGPEARKNAVACLEGLLETVNVFLTENPVPENTIFDK